ncbi:hypothetical protein ED312_14925 [Sinomicrobium pectinilyticum]|uniref:Uncharacterized protein n=1 Tax=Sinomicrobium pectinilyticum TaxID=1084421 RepID=A0A3N0E6T3_SINP1|nr:hypothetical protein ED312_14925 [Sinomicrobium pectinilyticum]
MFHADLSVNQFDPNPKGNLIFLSRYLSGSPFRDGVKIPKAFGRGKSTQIEFCHVLNNKLPKYQNPSIKTYGFP